jgi:hypothetical protein
LSVDIADGANAIPSLNALGSMANLIMLDNRLLDSQSLRQLYLNILIPFYDEFSIDRLNMAPLERGEDVGDIRNDRFERYSGVHKLVDELFENRNFKLPPVTRVGKLGGTKKREAREIAQRLDWLIRATEALRFQPVDQRDQIFTLDAFRPNPLSPFIARGDIVSMVLYGSRTDMGESRMHDITRYRPDAITKSDMLHEYAKLLSNKVELDSLDIAVHDAMGHRTHIAKGQAIFMDSFIRGSSHTELIPEVVNVDTHSDMYYDTVEMPFFGALSFLLYGVGSSSVTDSTNEYVRFMEAAMPMVPSLYPMYVYIERCIAQEAFQVYRDGVGADRSSPGYAMLTTHRDMVVDACLDALKTYFSSIDTDSEKRIRYMFDSNEMLAQGGNFDMPAELTSDVVSDVEVTPINARGTDLVIPGSLYNRMQFPVEMHHKVNPYKQMIDHMDKHIETVYVTFEPITPRQLTKTDKGSALVYIIDKREGVYIDFDTVLLDTPFIESEKLDITKAIDYTKFYLRRKGFDIKNFTGIKFSNLRTSYDVVKHDGLSDVVTQNPSITIDRDSKMLDYKLLVENVSVYYHMLTDRLGITEAALDADVEYLRGFAVHVSIDVHDFQKYLMNFDGTIPMEPGVYKKDALKQRLNDDDVATVLIKDGNGVPFSGPMTLSVREMEEYPVTNTLSSRPVLI